MNLRRWVRGVALAALLGAAAAIPPATAAPGGLLHPRRGADMLPGR